jgi:hypothetical protein
MEGKRKVFSLLLEDQWGTELRATGATTIISDLSISCSLDVLNKATQASVSVKARSKYEAQTILKFGR